MADRLFSITVTGFSPLGYELAVSASDVDAKKLPEAIAWLDVTLGVAGVRPVVGQVDKGGKRTATDQELPTCPIHGVAMERHSKGKSVWYSHKVENEDGSEFWCRGRAEAKKE